MKRICAIITVAVLLAAMVMAALPVSAATPGKTLYTYDASKAAKEWKAYQRGEWYYDKDGISVVNNDGRTGDDAWYYTYYGNKLGWTDYVIDCDLIGVAEGGIIFRSSNPSDKTVDAFDGYYCGTDSDFLFFGKDKNDKWSTIEKDGPDASYCYKIGYKQKMHWTIYVEGNQFTLYIDGSKFATTQVVDPENTYKKGGIAVRYRVYPGDESGYINHITVRELKKETAPSTKPSTPGETNSNDASSKNEKTESTLSTSSNGTAENNLSSATETTDPTESMSAAENISVKTVRENETVKIPTLLWIFIGIAAVGICAMPITLIVLSKKK